MKTNDLFYAKILLTHINTRDVMIGFVQLINYWKISSKHIELDQSLLVSFDYERVTCST